MRQQVLGNVEAAPDDEEDVLLDVGEDEGCELTERGGTEAAAAAGRAGSRRTTEDVFGGAGWKTQGGVCFFLRME